MPPKDLSSTPELENQLLQEKIQVLEGKVRALKDENKKLVAAFPFSYNNEELRKLATEAYQNLTVEERVRVERNHGNTTWRSFLTHCQDSDLYKHAVNVNVELTGAVRFKVQSESITLYRNCTMTDGKLDLNQFITPACTSESQKYCEGWGNKDTKGEKRESVCFRVVVHKGVPILPTLLIAPLSPREQEVLIPPNDGNVHFLVKSGEIHIYPATAKISPP